MGHGSLTNFQDTKGHVLIIQITKIHHHFNIKKCDYLMEFFLRNKLFCKCNDHLK
jgi:hypothetical protein